MYISFDLIPVGGFYGAKTRPNVSNMAEKVVGAFRLVHALIRFYCDPLQFVTDGLNIRQS